MPTPIDTVHGFDEVAYAAEETTFGELAEILGTGAFEFTEIDFGEIEAAERRPTKDKDYARADKDLITGAYQPIPFTISGTIRPSGTAGVAPNIGALLKQALGSEVVNAGTDVRYRFTDRPTNSLTIVRGERSGGWAESMAGCIIKTITFRGSEQEAEFEIQGEGVKKASFSKVEATGTLPGAATAGQQDPLTLVAGDSYKIIGAGQLVQKEGGTEVMKVVSVDYTTDTVTLERVVSGAAEAVALGDKIVPHFPTAVLTGEPLGEYQGSYSLFGATVYPTSWEVTINTGLDFRAFERGTAYRRGFKANKASIEGTISLVGDYDNMAFFGKANQFVKGDFLFTEGATAGSMFKVAAGLVELGRGSVPMPEDDETIVDIPLKPYGWNNTDEPAEIIFA